MNLVIFTLTLIKVKSRENYIGHYDIQHSQLCERRLIMFNVVHKIHNAKSYKVKVAENGLQNALSAITKTKWTSRDIYTRHTSDGWCDITFYATDKTFEKIRDALFLNNLIVEDGHISGVIKCYKRA